MHDNRCAVALISLVFVLSLVFVSSVTVKTVKKKVQRCDYTFVVQEFDPALCPTVLGHVTKGASATGSMGRPTLASNVANSSNVRSNNPDIPGYVQDGVVKEQPKRNYVTSTRESHLTNALNDMVRKIEDTRTKLESTISVNARLKTSSDQQTARIEGLESRLRDLEETLGVRLNDIDSLLHDHRQNLSRMAEEVADMALQKTYWKSVDTKLAGLMLDMTEVNHALASQGRQLEKVGVKDKVIEVQATSEVVTCSISPNATRYRDCEDYYANGHTQTGIYYIIPLYSSCAVPVYCDMDTPPGGWMVIQRRVDGSLNFNRNWTDYRSGFGAVGQEFWFGLDNIFLVTSQKLYELRIDLWDFFGSRVQATYGKFHIDGEREGYRLHVANHSGSVADGMQHHNEVQFSTPDRDQDTYSEYHCAKEWGAGWWFANCWFVILNGQYYNHTQVEYRGISWNEWKNEQLKMSEMKIRPSSL